MSNELIAIIGFGITIIGLQYSFMTRFENRLDKFEEKLLDIDRRLCRIEGAMSNKDCYMLKSDHSQRKDE